MFFSNEPKSNASANSCALESGFVESPFYRNCTAVRFYTAKIPSGHDGSYAITKFHFDLHQIRGPRAHLDFNAVLAFRTRRVIHDREARLTFFT
jgi:hypothetical protein